MADVAEMTKILTANIDDIDTKVIGRYQNFKSWSWALWLRSDITPDMDFPHNNALRIKSMEENF